MISIIHLYLNSYIYFMINIWIRFILHWYFGLFEGVDARAITIQREQYGGTVHLFIGTGRSPSKITFITSICIHNHNINHQGLTSLFLFSSASCFDLCGHLKPKLSFFSGSFGIRRYSSQIVSSSRGPSAGRIFNITLLVIPLSWGPSAERKTLNTSNRI